jgi:hypothetical protein
VWRAFLRGRRSTTLYETIRDYDESLLDRSVAELRAALRLDEADGTPPTERPADVLAFAAWVVVGALLLFGNVVLSPVLVAASLHYRATREAAPGAGGRP